MTADEEWLDALKAKFAVRLSTESSAFLALQASGDREGIIARAHKLAGLAGMMGAPEVGEMALQLEEAALAGGNFDTQFAALLAAIDEARP